MSSGRCQCWPGGSLKTSERKTLRNQWNYLEGIDRGRLEAGRGHCWMRFSAARPAPGGVMFKAHLLDGNPASAFKGVDTSISGDEKNHQPLEVLKAIRPFQLDSSARPRPRLPEEHCRAHRPHPLWSQGQQRQGKGCRDVARGPSALEHPLVSQQMQEGFLPPGLIRPEAFDHSQKPLRWLQAEGE